MPEPKISNEDVRQYGAKLHAKVHGWNCDCAPWNHEKFDRDAGHVLAALEAAGRLLPPGGEVKTQWVVEFEDGELESTYIESVALAWIGDPKKKATKRTVITWPDGSRYVGPWSPVLSDNSNEVPNG